MAERHDSVRNCASWMKGLLALFIVYSISIIKVESKTTVSIGILFDVQSLRHHGTLFASLAELNHNDPEINLRPVIATVDVADSFAVSNAMCDLISQDIIAIIGITNASSLSTIQSYSNTFNIPFVSIGSTHNFTLPSPFQIYLRPAFMGAIVDVLDFYQYNKALYIYDTDEGLMRLQDVFQYLNNQELLVDLDVRRVTELDQLSDILQPAKSGVEDVTVIILDVNSLDVQSVIKYLKDQIPGGSNTHLITVTLDQLSLDTIQTSNDKEMNITGFQLVPPDRFHRNKLFPDTFQGDIISSSDALIMDAIKLVRLGVEVAQEEEWFPRLWSSFPPALNKDTVKCSNFIVEKKPHGSLFMECLTRVNFYGKTGPVILDELFKRRKYILGVYQFRNGNRALKLAIWNPENGLKISPQVEDKTYTLIVNASKYSIPNVPNLNVYRK